VPDVSASVTRCFTGGVRRPVLLLTVAVALVAGACGDGDGGAAAPDPSGARPEVTGLALTDLATGDEVALADALGAPPGTPVLAWFWAPF
jgi:hypothetical protein